MSWTDERVETLKKMWSEGQSASQIAKELGGVTRNAVIGKVHRLGLSNRAGAPGAIPGTASGPASGSASGAAGGSGTGADAGKDHAHGPDMDDLDEDHDATDLSADATDGLAGSDDPDATDEGAALDAAIATPAHHDHDEPPEPPMSAARRAIIPAGQPLPPQPSLNEISPEALAKVNEVEKTAKRLTLMELTEKTCKWPVGDPATPDFWFCGLPVQQGKPYCEAHVGVAFQPMSARRDRRR